MAFGTRSGFWMAFGLEQRRKASRITMPVSRASARNRAGSVGSAFVLRLTYRHFTCRLCIGFFCTTPGPVRWKELGLATQRSHARVACRRCGCKRFGVPGVFYVVCTRVRSKYIRTFERGSQRLVALAHPRLDCP